MNRLHTLHDFDSPPADGHWPNTAVAILYIPPDQETLLCVSHLDM